MTCTQNPTAGPHTQWAPGAQVPTQFPHLDLGKTDANAYLYLYLSYKKTADVRSCGAVLVLVTLVLMADSVTAMLCCSLHFSYCTVFGSVKKGTILLFY